MGEFLISNEAAVRLVAFVGIFGVMAMWEIRQPRRELSVAKLSRWSHNIGLTVLNTLILRVLFPAGAIGVAAFATSNGWGVLNLLQAPLWLTTLVAVIALDLVIWLQHVMVHAVPALWRLHRVHHADLDYDLTTGARFHPLEIILSMLIKLATIAALGPPVIAVIIFEVILNGMSMFNHANVRLPDAWDRRLRLLLVTPDMHRVHHSIEDDETNSNFGFNLSIWDRLFGTYRAQPRGGHIDMAIGIRDFRDPLEADRLPGMLMLPFRGQISGYAINRRDFQSRHDDS